MDKIYRRIHGATHTTKINMNAAFQLLQLALDCEMFVASRISFRLYDYMVMPFG